MANIKTWEDRLAELGEAPNPTIAAQRKANCCQAEVAELRAAYAQVNEVADLYRDKYAKASSEVLDLRAALSAQEAVQPELVAWANFHPDGHICGLTEDVEYTTRWRNATPLYTRPLSPAAGEVGMTPEQIEAEWNALDGKAIIAGESQLNWNKAIRLAFARAILKAAKGGDQ